MDKHQTATAPPAPLPGRHLRRVATILTALAALLLVTTLTAPTALAVPEINTTGPAGTAHVVLRPFGGIHTLQLTYSFVNTQGATATHITLTPVGLNAKSTEHDYIGNRADGTILYTYNPGDLVSVGIHVVFLTPFGVQDNSRKPLVVSYPK